MNIRIRWALGMGLAGVVATIATQAATKQWGGGVAAWSDPAAWSPAGVPAPEDEVEIGRGVVLLGAGVTISNRLTWTGGDLQSGGLRVAPGGQLVVRGAEDKGLLNVTLSNGGTLRVEGPGRVALRFTGYGQGILLTNEAGASFELIDGPGLEAVNPGGYPPAAFAFVNEGMVRKTGAGSMTLGTLVLANRGRLEVVEGQLQLAGGGISPGQFEVREGASVDLLGGSYQLEGSRWDGAGPVRVRASTTLEGRFHAANFGLAAGDLAGRFDISGGFEWTGGNLVGAQARLGAGRHRITGSDPKHLLQSSLANAGVLEAIDTAVGLRFTGYGQSVVVTNEATGEWRMIGEALIEQRNAGGWPPAQLAIINEGTWQASGGGVQTVASVPLVNRGQIEVREGSLHQSGGGGSSGGWTIAEGAEAVWTDGAYQLEGARQEGPGRIRLQGAITLTGSMRAEHLVFAGGNLSGTCTIEGGFGWTDGTLVDAALQLGPGEHWIRSEGQPRMQRAGLANAGRLVLAGSTVNLQFTGYAQSITVTNLPGGVLELIDGAGWVQENAGGWPPVNLALVNEGTVRTSGSGTNHLRNVPFHSAGGVEIGSGVLEATGGGTSSGGFDIAEGARLTLGGGTYQLAGSRWTGVGAARITANCRLLGAFTAANFGIESGSVDGDFEVSGGFRWTGGTLSAVRVRLGPGDHRIDGSGDHLLHHATLLNAGRLVVEDSLVSLGFTGYGQAVVVTNEASGVLELVGQAGFEQRNSGGWPPVGLAIANEGRLVSRSRAENRITSIPLHNAGQLEVQTGTLIHTGGGVSPGVFQVAAGSEFRFSGNTYDLASSRWRGPGAAVLEGSATVNGSFEAERFVLAAGDVAGTWELRGGFHWTGGRLVGAAVRLGPGEHEVTGPADKALLAATLRNAGRLVLRDTNLGLLFTGYAQGALLVNEAEGTLELAAASRVEQRNPGGWPPAALGVINEGRLRATGPGRSVLAAVPLTNRGVGELLGDGLRLESNLTLEAASQLELSLATGPALEVTGTAVIAGHLGVRVPPGFPVAHGTAYPVLESAGLQGAFSNAAAGAPGHVFQFDVTQDARAVRVTARNTLEQPVTCQPPRLENGRFRFDLTGQPGLRQILESSTNLVDWVLESEGEVAEASRTVVDDRVTVEPNRYFRVRLLP